MGSQRKLRIVLVLAVLVGFAGLAIMARGGLSPLTVTARVDAARDRIQRANRELAAPGPPAERWYRYRAGLREAESLLTGAVAESPTYGRAVVHLARVRWELDHPNGEQRERIGRLAAAGAARVPRSPRAQRQAGELLFELGERDAGLEHLHRAVALDPEASPRVVAFLARRGLALQELLVRLPAAPQLLVAAAREYTGEDLAADLLEIASSAGIEPDAALLRMLGRLSSDTGLQDQYLRYLNVVGERPETDVEVERAIQRASALQALGRAEAALSEARRACAIAPGKARPAEFLGSLELRTGNPEAALVAFRDALAAAAATGLSPAVRARIYGQLGQANEAVDETEPAIDAYRRARELDPEEPVSGRRLAALGAAAGTR